MSMEAGKLRNRITIQQRNSGQDALGAPLNTWSTFATVWARIVSRGGGEQYTEQQFSPEVTHQVTIRWIDGVSPMMRVLTTDGKILDILYANYGERKLDAVVLQCKERMGLTGDLNVG